MLKEVVTFQKNFCGCNVVSFIFEIFFPGLHIINSSRWVDLPQSHTINHHQSRL